MTTEPVPQAQAAKSGIALCAPLGNAHLTGEEFGALLAISATQGADPELARAEAHLLACEACAAELAGLREAIALFREASSAYADSELRRMPRWILPDKRVLPRTIVPAYWVAAAAMLLTALLPMQVLRRHAVAPQPTVASSAASGAASGDRASTAQSDEALLDDVNREISASLPAPMQALADPTSSAAAAGSATSNRTLNRENMNQSSSSQGKDQP